MYIKPHKCVNCGSMRADVCPTCMREFFMYHCFGDHGISSWKNSEAFIEKVDKDFDKNFKNAH